MRIGETRSIFLQALLQPQHWGPGLSRWVSSEGQHRECSCTPVIALPPTLLLSPHVNLALSFQADKMICLIAAAVVPRLFTACR